ncbi:MAG: hypothetical protein JSR97_10170 [Verrucomicrobia bacterium]|nr:hypothetical protein [Verrucomicrobiota bacterium]
MLLKKYLHPTAEGGGSAEIIIDLEECVKENKQHPHVDPGIIVKYKLKIDDEAKLTGKRKLDGESILGLVGKSHEQYCLIQLKHEHGHVHEVEIAPHDMVDFGVWGIEKFLTKEIFYHFFIGKKEYSTPKAKLTVRQILEDYAKVDPAAKTLAKKEDGGYHEYKDLDEVIPLKGCPHFVLFDNDPTGVS